MYKEGFTGSRWLADRAQNSHDLGACVKELEQLIGALKECGVGAGQLDRDARLLKVVHAGRLRVVVVKLRPGEGERVSVWVGERM